MPDTQRSAAPLSTTLPSPPGPGSLPRLVEGLRERLTRVSPRPERFAVETVDALLELGESFRASDLHLVPLPQQRLRVLYRIDGVLHWAGELPQSGPNIVARLKVLAELLTYQTDTPQEGRIRSPRSDLETRVSTFPTVHGEKGVVRFFVGSGQYLLPPDLGYPSDVLEWLLEQLRAAQGLLLACGPAGSGKTTTLYAALRHLVQGGPHPRSLCTLEDPIEALIDGAAQSAMQPHLGFDYATALKSLMRQDPEVIMVGEIRDRETATTVFQASLTGHLVLSTFHAGRSVEAIGRLLDMGLEPYVVRSGLLGILTQRLLRRRCDCQSPPLASSDAPADSPCPRCGGSGYAGRLVLAETFSPRPPAVSEAILRKLESDEIEARAIAAGFRPLRSQAQAALNARLTTPEEVWRVLGTDRPLPA